MFIHRLLPLVVAAAAFAVSGASLAQSGDDAKSIKPDDTRDLSEPTLYELLLGEIAQQRGDYALAAKTYLELARRTGDARVARRAVEVANPG
jgi:hypothetical protein